MKDGYVIVTINKNEMGMLESEKFEWIGGPKTTISIHHIRKSPSSIVDLNNNLIVLGPYRLRIINREFHNATCIREDYPLWWWFVFVHQFTQFARLIFARIIHTLVIWRLAEYHPESFPSINDVYLIQWVKKKIKYLIK